MTSSVAALLLVALALVAYVWWAMRRLLRPTSERELLPSGLPTSIDEVERWLRERDAKARPAHPMCHSGVTWANGVARKTGVCVVYLHGWGAGPAEIEPVDVRISAALGANCLRFRYTAHGLGSTERGSQAMVLEQSHTVLRADGATAYALARLLGERVVLIGCSTGGALAMWLSSQQWVHNELAACILISPAIRLRVPRAPVVNLCVSWLLLLLPQAASRRLLQLINGGPIKRSGMPIYPGARGEAQVATWTRAYPIEAVLHLFGLIMLCRATITFGSLTPPMLAFASPLDPVLSFDATMDAMRGMPRGELDVIYVAEDESPHVLTGWITSPSTIDRVVARSVAFLERELDGRRVPE